MKNQKQTKFWTLGLCFGALLTIAAPHSANANEKDCTAQTAKRQQEEEERIDTQKAIALAKASKDFEAKTKGHDARFHSIYFVHSFDPKTCDYQGLDSVNVVHRLTRNERYEKNLVAHLDRELSKITEVSEHKGKYYIGASQGSGSWSGYSGYLADASQTDLQVLNFVGSIWTVPTITSPDIGDTYCVEYACILSVWVGLYQSADAADSLLVQAGSASHRRCGYEVDLWGHDFGDIDFECTNAHELWYEFLPSQSVACSNVGTTKAGDSIKADVLKHIKDNKQTYYYGIKVTNSTTGKVCSVSSQYYKMDAYFAAFMIESGSMTGEQTDITLPKFSDVTMSSATIVYSENGGLTKYSLYDVVGTLSANDSAGYTKYLLYQDGSTLNINVGKVSSGGNFTQRYLTSKK